MPSCKSRVGNRMPRSPGPGAEVHPRAIAGGCGSAEAPRDTQRGVVPSTRGAPAMYAPFRVQYLELQEPSAGNRMPQTPAPWC